MSDLVPGSVVLGRYVVEKQIGAGGMGAVYAARHASLGHRVAIKTLTPSADPLAVQRFEREARLMAKVRHANVVSVIDVGLAADDMPCIVMEFVEGAPLDGFIEARKVLPWQDAGTIVLGILAGLEAIHAQGIAHRDMKPSNVVLVGGSADQPKLIDFGIARTVEGGGRTGALTQAGVVIGTPAYMAPEQLVGGPVDHRADLYAVALIWYEMVTRTIVFEGETFSHLLRRVRENAPAPEAPQGMPEIPDAVADVILAALSMDPNDRPQDARSFMARLRSATRLSAPRTGMVPRPLVERLPTPPQGVPVSDRTQGGIPSAMDRAAVGRVRWVMAAVLPPSRLASPEERKWLAATAGEKVKGYALGAQVWLAVFQSTCSEDDAKRDAAALAAKVHGRFGPTTATKQTVVPHDFALSVAQVTGLKPLPAEVRALVDAAMKA